MVEGHGYARTLDALRHELGLDRPVHVQYLEWIGNIVLRGDFGRSCWTRQPILEEFVRRFPVTLELALLTILVSVVIGVVVGILSAVRQDSVSDYVGRILAILALSIPYFGLAVVVVVVPSIYFKWTPVWTYVAFTADPLQNLKIMLVPALALAYLVAFLRRRKVLQQLGDLPLLERLSLVSPPRLQLKAALATGAVFFLVLALARPQFGMKMSEVRQQGADIIIAIDVSSSMLAEDLKPDRLERAKNVLSTLVQQLGGNRVGIIAFAGTAFWQCPLTLDISGVNLFLQIMDANLIPLPGTSIGSALRLGIAGLAKTAPKSKAIVLLTDGEDHNSDPDGATREAARNGIKVFTIGFGNPAGEPIPLKDEQGTFVGYKKNRKDEVVMSRLDEALLARIAAATGGEYFRATDGTLDTGRLVDDLRTLDRQKLASTVTRQYEDRYQYFLCIAVLLLLAELLIPTTRRTSEG
jgi:Ca-activated chloride channel family protein